MISFSVFAAAFLWLAMFFTFGSRYTDRPAGNGYWHRRDNLPFVLGVFFAMMALAGTLLTLGR